MEKSDLKQPDNVEIDFAVKVDKEKKKKKKKKILDAAAAVWPQVKMVERSERATDAIHV